MKKTKSHMLIILKKYTLIVIFTAFLLVLSGCGVNQAPITPDSPGIWDHYFIYTFSSILTYVASFFHGNYGLSIILVTIVVRLCLLPFMLSQLKSQEKMKELSPEIQALKEKYKTKDVSSQRKLQEETMALYQKHKVNPLSMGCFPMLIQFPILIAFYYSIVRTHEISTHNFLWFNLGHSDPFFILPILVAVTSYFQSSLSMKEAVKANPQMSMMKYLSPIMMAFFSMGAPAAIPLYWIVGSLFMILQHFVLKFLKKKHTDTLVEKTLN